MDFLIKISTLNGLFDQNFNFKFSTLRPPKAAGKISTLIQNLKKNTDSKFD